MSEERKNNIVLTKNGKISEVQQEGKIAATFTFDSEQAQTLLQRVYEVAETGKPVKISAMFRNRETEDGRSFQSFILFVDAGMSREEAQAAYKARVNGSKPASKPGFVTKTSFVPKAPRA